MRQAGKAELASALTALRVKTLASLEHIDMASNRVPQLAVVNLPIWELGHVGWVQEHWCLRYEDGQCRHDSLFPHADRLLDSAGVDHAWRWDLKLPPIDQVHAYLAEVLERSVIALEKGGDDDASLYFHRLCYFHEVMHLEAFFYTWQTLGYAKPSRLAEPPALRSLTSQTLDITDGSVILGSQPDQGFVFDNEKWALEQSVEAFNIDAQPVSYQRFAQFVDDGGYAEPRFWSTRAWQRIQSHQRGAPEYWRRNNGQWQVRRFNQWIALPANQAVMHISADEAQAYCRWAGRRLPTEAQWTRAVQSHRDFDWGRHVWEWTASDFEPLPGFSPDPYKEYSQPWFGDHRVVKGGSFATERALVDARFRNFYLPERHDPFIGFRTCSA